jgi:Tfp pilus assembly protein PilF
MGKQSVAGNGTAKQPGEQSVSDSGPTGQAAKRARWTLPAAIGLALVAIALRVWTVATLVHDLRISRPTLDASYYLDLARRINHGNGWPVDPHFFGPLYPWLLSGLFHIAPAQPLTVQIAQSVLGLVTLALLVATVRRRLGSAAAWATAALYILSGPILAMENIVLMESVMLFLATAALSLWPDSERRPLTHLAFGLTCGLMATGRASFLLLPVAALLFSMRKPGRQKPHDAGHAQAHSRGRLLLALLIIVGSLAPLVPQIIHQTRTTGHLQILTLNGGMNLYIGNNPRARGIFSSPPELDMNDDLTARRSASIQAGRTLTLEESSQFWMDRALGFMREQPGRALWLLGRKALLFLSPREIPQLYNFETLEESTPPLRVAFMRFGWVLPLAVLGVLAGSRRLGMFSGSRRRGATTRQDSSSAGSPTGEQEASGCTRGPAHPSQKRGIDHLIPWLVLIAVGWLQMIVFFATGRFRIAVLPGFLALAGVGVAYLIDMVRRKRFLPIGLTVAAMIALQFLPAGYPADKARAFDAFHLGNRHILDDHFAEALASYRKATELCPASGEAWHGTGVALYKMGRLPQAVDAFIEALKRMPHSAITYYSLGLTYHRLGEDERAVRALGAAVRFNPRRPDYHHDFGIALARIGRLDEAVREWQATLQLDPGHQDAQQHLERVRQNANQGPGDLEQSAD